MSTAASIEKEATILVVDDIVATTAITLALA